MPEESIWTSALATARFFDDQRPNGTAFVIGEAGVTTALYEVGYTMTDRNPDYVVIGDRMDTDIVAGLEAGLEAILVLTGVTKIEDTARYPYTPSRIVDSVADLAVELGG